MGKELFMKIKQIKLYIKEVLEVDILMEMELIFAKNINMKDSF